MERSQMGATIKTEEETVATSTVYSASEINLDHVKQQPGSVQSVESEPAMLVKKEIVDYGSEDDSEKQCIQDVSTSAGADGLYEANSISQGDWINVKPELEEMDIGPTVLQHMDIHYALNKSTVDGCSEEMRYSRVKEDTEDKLRDSLTPHQTMTKEQIHELQSLQCEHHLASICSVHVFRLDVFQCDLCHAVYTKKDILLQHLQAVHAYPPQTSLIAKFRKAEKRNAADNKSQLNYDQTTTEDADNDEAHMKSRQRQQEDLQKHRTSISKGIKCARIFRKQHLLSGHNNMHQRNSRETATARDTVASSSQQSGDKRTKSKQEPFEYEVCEKDYSSYKIYRCKICDRRFARNGYLTEHMRIHTGEKPYQCKICEARFLKSTGLTQHVRVHTGEKPYQCKICDARFAQNGHLTEHMKIHTGEKPYQCKNCGARFSKSTGLTQHVRVHTGEKPYQCKICDARFAQNGHLTGHMKIHTGEKPYQCKNCDARFSKSTGLTQHVRVHTGEKPYQCKICNTRFSINGNLTKHMRVHTGKQPYQCKICDARYGRNSDLTKHITVHLGEKC